MLVEPAREFIDPDHLTAALRKSGALPAGKVVRAEITGARDHILSHVARIEIACEGGQGPGSLILKTGLPALDAKGWPGGRHEVAFYQQVAAAHPGRLVPRCHEASWDTGTNSWHLLLEDLSASHSIATAWPLPAGMDQCSQIVAALAGMHALWWDHPQLGTEIGSWPDGPLPGRELEDLAHRYAAFADMMGERLSRERRDLYERFLRSTPRLMERHARRRELTIVHGDAHAWNVFLPIAPGRDGARIFDWDSWRIDIGAADLAYLMAMHWYPELRQRAEVRLLDTYHEELLREGVGGYSRDDLAADYRLAVLWHLAVPVHQASYGIPPVIWWNNLERILLAVADLGCSELLS